MKLEPQDLEKIARLTLEHYNQRAEEFWEGTRDHDVGQNIAALLQYIDSKPPYTILDFGCGPGRDLKVFAELGHIAVGLEGAAHFAVMARAYSGCEVWQQDFLELDLPDNHFDGVFANAALFHVPSQELPRVLLELHACLKPGGVLFSSNPHGHNEEGWNSGRRRSASAGLSLRVSRECGLTPPGEIVSAACEEMNGVGQSDQREQPQVFVSVSLQVAASPAIACE